MPGAEILFTWTISPAMLAAADSLKWVHISGAGVEKNLFPEFRDSNILLTNSRGIHGAQMSEWVLGALLHLAQRFSSVEEWRRSRVWRANKEVMTRTSFILEGMRALIVGYGHIGSVVARKLAGIGVLCDGLVMTRRQGSIPLHPTEKLPELIGNYDIVVIALPLTHATEKLFDRAMFARMKPGSILVNIARGKIVDEPAMIEALKNGPLGYVALDVFTEEPLPEDSPLFELANVFMTPHISGNFPEYTKLAIGSFLRNLKRYLDGQPLENVVDKKKGY